MAKLSSFIMSGAVLMLIVIGFSIFVGGIYPKYSDSTVNDSFEGTYNRMSDIYEQSNQLQDNILNKSSEGDKRIDFNALDAFGILKTAFLKIPAILIDTLHILIGAPTETSSGGVLYVFAETIGIPLELISIILTIATMTLVFLVINSIRGGG